VQSVLDINVMLKLTLPFTYMKPVHLKL